MENVVRKTGKLKKVRRILVIDILILTIVTAMFATVKCQKRDAFTYKGDYKSLSLEGKWYKVEVDTVHTVTLTKNGKYQEEDMSGKSIKSGNYKIGNHVIKFDDKIYSMNYVDEESQFLEKFKNDSEDLSEYEMRKYFYTISKESNKVYYFSNETAAADQIEDNCSTNEYYEESGLFDEDGFAIDGNNILLAYRGSAGEITIPDNVVEIAENAMSADYERANNTDRIIIPETVKKIDSGAFSFSTIKQVYIKQGVEEIDTWAFGDSSIEEIHFPESVNSLQEGIFDTEEGLEGLKIYCKQGSTVDEYLKNYPPEGKYEIIYE